MDGKVACAFSSSGAWGGGAEIACQSLQMVLMNFGFLVFGVTDYAGKMTTCRYGAIVAREPRETEVKDAGRLLGRRLSWAAIRTLRSHGYNQTFALIVGAGRVARKTERALRHASWMGIKNVGFVDETWYNPGDGNYYLAARDMPTGPVLGVISAKTRLWLTVPPVCFETANTVRRGKPAWSRE